MGTAEGQPVVTDGLGLVDGAAVAVTGVGAGAPENELDDVEDDAAGVLPVPSFDSARAEAAIRELLYAVGEDPDRDGLINTPARVARAFAEQFAGLHIDPSTVLATSVDENHNEMILVRDIDMYSTCEHHLVPFFGKAHVGYIPGPNGRVTGLSKLARLVDGYSKRPQVQERLTTQIADALVRRLQPAGAIVVIEAEHLCMAMRGIRKPGAVTTTSAVRGIFQSQDRTRAEAMSLITGR
jgi:GTP cyclohydrolase I